MREASDMPESVSRRAALAGSVLSIGLILCGWLYSGSLQQFAARLKARTHDISPAKYAAKVNRMGITSWPARFVIRNYTGSPIRVLGAEVGCRCSVPADLPRQIAALATADLVIEIDVSIAPDVLSEDVTFFVETESGIEMTRVELGLVFGG